MSSKNKCITITCPADTNCADHKKQSLTEHCEACTFCTTCLLWEERTEKRDVYMAKLQDKLDMKDIQHRVASTLSAEYLEKLIKAEARIKRLTITAIAGIIIGIIGIAGFIYGATQGNAAYNSGWTHGIEYATEQANYVADTLCGQKEYELYSDLTWYCLADDAN
jgi:hypothetical protein